MYKILSWTDCLKLKILQTSFTAWSCYTIIKTVIKNSYFKDIRKVSHAWCIITLHLNCYRTKFINIKFHWDLSRRINTNWVWVIKWITYRIYKLTTNCWLTATWKVILPAIIFNLPTISIWLIVQLKYIGRTSYHRTIL